MKDGLVFYQSFYEAIKPFDDEIRLQAYEAIISYGITGEEPDCEGVAKSLFIMAKPLIDASNKRYTDGKKGGRPPTKNTALENDKTMVSENKKLWFQKNQNPNNNNNNNNNNNIKNICGADAPSAVEDKSDGTHATEDVEDASDSLPVPYKEIVDYLNKKTGAHFMPKSKDTHRAIHARWKEGYRWEDFVKVIDNMAARWSKDPKMCQYLRPITLFSPKFESYLNLKAVQPQTSNSFRNFEQRDLDFDDLEAQLDRQMAGGGT